MRGIIFKTIGSKRSNYRPARDVADVTEDLLRWAAQEDVEPITCYAGYGITLQFARWVRSTARSRAMRGEPLFPHSVECMRLISGYIAAFGISTEELRTMCTVNPERLLKVPVNA
jgi:hypothetical protein